ncbi:MAG: LysM peptidoglycan-binding domain-containing protein [Gemmatimonadetes bacterium]|nr:LysM peptidoglycan-binding domain-containing protein [Gemmatimonadota bacterium]
MRRTTISRSKIGPLLTVGLLLGAPAVRAQDPLQMGAPQQRPQVHIVQQGETLWALAELYYGDPLLWPEIYRLNTLVVEDPHWIYPGEELVLGPVTPAEALPEMPVEQPPVVGPPVAEPPALPPGDTSQAAMQRVTPVEAPPVETPVVEAPPPPPPPPADASGPTIFSRRGPGAGMTRVEALGGEVYRYRPVRRGEFYAAGFLTENASFPWARVLGDASDPPMERRIQTSSAMIYQTVAIQAPGGATYQAGDSLLVAQLSRRVPGWGDVVVPSGVVRVTRCGTSARFRTSRTSSSLTRAARRASCWATCSWCWSRPTRRRPRCRRPPRSCKSCTCATAPRRGSSCRYINQGFSQASRCGSSARCRNEGRRTAAC